MNHERILTSIDLNDPGKGFSFAYDDGDLRIWYLDWKNRRVTFCFKETVLFSHRFAARFRGLPEGEVLEIFGSDLVASVIKERGASRDDNLHHYIISTNADEWCEIVAGSIDVAIAD